MKSIFVLLIGMMLCLAPEVSPACEGTPLLIASAAYTHMDVPAALRATPADSTGNMEFVHVEGGCYCMGAAEGSGPGDVAPSRQVCVDDFYMGKYEVTQAQYKAIMGKNPSSLSNCGDNCPVVDVSWNDVQEFTRRLNERTGSNFRLPTEAEWEHAVRIGGTTPAGGSSAKSASRGGLRPVGSSQPNSLGIHDLLGSVWEWTGDRYRSDYYNMSTVYNPEGPTTGMFRALRGGSWDDAPKSINPAMRAKYEPWIKRPWVGFRLLSPDQFSAKFRHPEVLNAKAVQGNQCTLRQQASIR
jgi:formylglycine-generating enzyme required for sulfatase activity